MANASHERSSKWAVSYYFSDHLKIASVITDAAGNIKEDEDYYPWGGELLWVNSDSNHYKFGGHERDNETSLDYLLARYYSNPLGRFLTPDWASHPIEVPYANFGNPQSLNLYAYTKNNPTTFGDADGHEIIDPRVINDAVNRAGNAVGNVLVGVAKGSANFFIKWDNGVRDALNKIGGHYEHFDELKPSNATQQKVMGVGEAAAVLVITRGRGKEEVIPEAPTGRPGRLGSPATRAQNGAIADSLESRGFTITGGGGRLPEEYIPGPGWWKERFELCRCYR